MTLQPRSLSRETIRRFLVEFADQVPAITPRMVRFNEQGVEVPRIRVAPPGQAAIPAAVALLLYPGEDGFTMVFTRRTSHLPTHAGQISFPGGGVDPDDSSDLHAALREVEEELGTNGSAFELWAPLKSIYIPHSNYLVQPYVMYTDRRPDFHPNPEEVAEVLEISMGKLLEPDTRMSEPREYQGDRFLEPFFLVGPHKIWGATAVILDQFLSRVEAGLAQDR